MISEVKTEKHMDAFGLGDRQTDRIDYVEGFDWVEIGKSVGTTWVSNNNVIMMMTMLGDDKIKDSVYVCERELIVSSCGETATYCGILGVTW